MTLIIILIRIALIILALAVISILIIRPFTFDIISMSIFGFALTLCIWQVTAHLKERTAPVLYLPKLGIMLGSAISISGLLSLMGVYFHTDASSFLQALYKSYEGLLTFLAGLLIIRTSKTYTTKSRSCNAPLYKNGGANPLITYILLILLACLITRPTSIEGVLIACVVVLVFEFWIYFSLWWARKFSGSLLMSLIPYCLLAAFIFGLHGYIIPLLNPYIEEYFT